MGAAQIQFASWARAAGRWALSRVAAAVHQCGGNWQSLFDRATDPSEGTQISMPFAQSVWVMRAIKHVSGPVASVPLLFSGTKRGDTATAVEDPERSAFWECPAVGLSWFDFVEATVGWLKLAGESFWILDDSFARPFPDVSRATTKLIVARPDRMREVVNGNRLEGWEFSDGAGQRHALLPDQVIQLKLWNPYNPWRGLAEYEAARVAAESDFAAGKFQLNSNQSNGDRGVYVIAKSGVVDKDQREQITAQLRQKRDLAARGINRPAFIAGDVTIEDPKVAAPDANFVTGRIQNRHEIFMAFGVPPSMADIKASYSIGSASDRFMLIEDTCQPMGCKVTEAIEVVEKKRSGVAIYAWLNWNAHSVMKQVRRELADVAQKFWSMGVPLKTVNEWLDMGMPQVPGWDVGYLPFSVAPVGTAPPEANADFSEPADEPDEPDVIGEMMRVLKRPATHECSMDVPPRGLSAAQLARWRAHMAKRRESMKGYASAFNRVLMLARAEVLQKIESSSSSSSSSSSRSAITRAVAADFLFDLKVFADGFKVAMRKAGQRAIDTAVEQALAEIGFRDPWQMPPPKAIEFLRLREKELSGVPETVARQVRNSLSEGIENGETMKELADRARGTFNALSKFEAQRIAQTETASAFGFSRQESMTAAGIHWKQWLTSGNPNVRPAHEAAHEQTVPIDQPFHVGGEALMYPGDPSGSPGNVINCHCVSVAVERGPQ